MNKLSRARKKCSKKIQALKAWGEKEIVVGDHVQVCMVVVNLGVTISIQ